MRFYWLLLSVFSTVLFALPAEAGRLLFWRFESGQNRLVFTTDDGVQPRAQLIPNPTRVVIDLPGIRLGRPNVTQPMGGAIRNIRVGQFNAETTRLVIELAPGYTVDPQQVKIRGLSPTQWTVELPTPQLQTRSPDSSLNSPINLTAQPSSARNNLSDATRTSDSKDFQVTRSGLYVKLDRNGDAQRVEVIRNRDRKAVQIELPGATLPSSLIGQTLDVNNYGVSQIQFDQASSSPPLVRLKLQVSDSRANWKAIYSRLGGVVILPPGGSSGFKPDSPLPSVLGTTGRPNNSQLATITAVDLAGNSAQLLIRADRPVRGNGRWNAGTRVYEIRIPNAQLANPMRGPQLGRNGPIYQVRIRQETANTVVILVQPSLGARLGNLTQLNSQLLALDLRSLQTRNSDPRSINVPPASSTFEPYDPLPNLSDVPKGRLLVIIDPGHGGKDPGAIGIGGIQEKDIILPISQQVSQILEKQGIRVMLTRKSDYFVSLQGRTDLANRARADLFVSIHANSMGKGRPDVSGLEVYYFGDRRLADTIQRSILRTVDIRDRGVRKARFYVLRYSRMPATLVEVGFLTGTEDAPKLSSSSYQRQMAEAIARGIIEFIRQNRL